MKATELKSEGLKKEYTVVIPAADFEKQVEAKINQIAQKHQNPQVSVRVKLRKKC